MPYIGNTAADRFVAPKATTRLSGNGSTTAFTLEHAVGSDEDILVSVDGVIQEPSIAYAVSSGTTLTFTAAPSSGTNNIFVCYLFRTVGTVSHPSNNALTATTGTFTGAFTSLGIDDNADATAITIDSSENVGIGTTSPSAKLTVDGATAFTTLELASTSGSATSAFMGVTSGSDLAVKVNGSEAIRATNDSVGGLGHTSGMAGVSGEGFVFRKNTGGNHLEIGHDSGAGNGFSFLICRFNGSSIGGISQDGTTGVDFDTSSDYRLKENVSYDFDATTRLKKLKPCRFNFIAEPERTVDGFLAHEVNDAVPQAVKGDKDAVDEKGNIQSQMIDHSKIVPLLVKSLQEALVEIDTLKTKVAALESK